MPKNKRWTYGPVAHGYGEVRFLKWQYFVTWINQEMLGYTNYIWRGQRREDWKLTSTLDRLASKSKHAYPPFRAHLERFKFASRGRRGPVPPLIEKENDWWALGQHHGLATPLLDWTTSPFTAAYFAFMEEGTSQTKYRAIFALQQFSLQSMVDQVHRRELAAHAERKKGKPGNDVTDLTPTAAIEFVRPLSDENPRLISQGGLFTRTQVGITIDDWVKTHLPKAEKSYVLMKLLIPHADRDEALRMLNRMNINHATLFPDLSGAARFCNAAIEIERY